MPGDGFGISDEERGHFHQWIATGASWPEGKAGELRERSLVIKRDDF